ncbi:seminal plasma protein HSP-1-like isoform X1 [Ochotona princeps]|uniref:seminal plasma protein HSP-1-like isoform X1 n=1 Tax=Ochotona princeps TaxID=9978 RepID=UPI002714D58C|nr:seminal plasma protein HSP-1-like isoform X1 [Ochotona princeps]
MSPRRWAVTLIWVCACVILQLHCVTAEDKCVFPFKYRGKQYFDCTTQNSLYKWCSLTDEYSGAWKYCTNEDRGSCVFPFIYDGQVFHKCTSKGSFHKKLWCSLTRNYDRDKAWKYC